MLLQLLAALAGRSRKPAPATTSSIPATRIDNTERQGIVFDRPWQEILAKLDGDELADAFDQMPPSEQLKFVEGELAKLADKDRKRILPLLAAALKKPWIPNPGQQTAAYRSKADLLLYGGQAGGGKSDLLIGCAAMDHKRALIVRRESTELDGLVARSREVLTKHGDLNKVDREWSLHSGTSIKFGGMKDPDSWRSYAGRPRDFMGFDEGGEFLEEQVSSILAWLRAAEEFTGQTQQRCRAIIATNPPRGSDGEWLIEWFAPWLEPSFPNPAHPGDLRWAIQVNKKTIWVDGPGVVEIDGEKYTPLSRTFIPASLDDNPYLASTNYRAQLQSLQEPLRSQLLKGDFLAGRKDDAWQVIPSEWVKLAQERWTNTPPVGVAMTSIGVDVAQGGADETILAPRFGTYFAEVKAFKGIDTKDGPSVAGHCVATMRDGCGIAIDLGGGWGGSALDHLKQQNFKPVGIIPAATSNAKSREGLGFVNLRAEMWWKFREALDPNSGTYIALPPDPKLAADLITPRWMLKKNGYQIESKDDIRARLGRSTDRGDAVVMAWLVGSTTGAPKNAHRLLPSMAVVGHAHAKKYAKQQSYGSYRR